MLISLVIPTRERASYLKYSIETCLQVEDDAVEIIVSDNSSRDDTRQVVASFDDPRLRYICTHGRVSMRQNFDFAMSETRGDYVIFIGDDDGIMPHQFPALRAILEARHPAALSWTPLKYEWPIDGYGSHPGTIRFDRFKIFGQPVEVCCDELRKKVLAAQLDLINRMPGIYHGCVSRSLMQFIKDRTGNYFNGRIPDFYVAYTILFNRDSFLHAGHPFTIGGSSPASNGNAHHAYKSTDKRAAPAAQFMQEVLTDPVQDVIPGHVPSDPMAYFPTLETVLRDFPQANAVIDRGAWYYRILSNTRRDDLPVWTATLSVLQDYAKKTGTSEEFQTALARPVAIKAKSSLVDAVSYNWKKLWGFRLTVDDQDSNTVATAAKVADQILGCGYRIDGDSNRKLWGGAWARGMKRQVLPRVSGRAA